MCFAGASMWTPSRARTASNRSLRLLPANRRASGGRLRPLRRWRGRQNSGSRASRRLFPPRRRLWRAPWKSRAFSAATSIRPSSGMNSSPRSVTVTGVPAGKVAGSTAISAAPASQRGGLRGRSRTGGFQDETDIPIERGCIRPSGSAPDPPTRKRPRPAPALRRFAAATPASTGSWNCVCMRNSPSFP